MIGFRIVLNGKQLVTAGLGGHHVVSAILSSVVRDPATKPDWPAGRVFVERELEFSVGGLDSDRNQHVDWLMRKVKAGDRIEIEIVDADELDAPRSRRPKKPSPDLAAKPKPLGKRGEKHPARGSAPALSSASIDQKKKLRRKK